MATPEEIERLRALLDKARIGILTTTDRNGHLVSRPMAVQEREFDGELWDTAAVTGGRPGVGAAHTVELDA